jgi:hypothetical protein
MKEEQKKKMNTNFIVSRYQHHIVVYGFDFQSTTTTTTTTIATTNNENTQYPKIEHTRKISPMIMQLSLSCLALSSSTKKDERTNKRDKNHWYPTWSRMSVRDCDVWVFLCVSVEVSESILSPVPAAVFDQHFGPIFEVFFLVAAIIVVVVANP